MGPPTMLASPPQTLLQLTSFPPPGRSFVVSAKFQRRQRRRYRDDPADDDERIGGVGFAVLTALDSSRPQRNGDSPILVPSESPMVAGAFQRDEKLDRKEVSVKEREAKVQGGETPSSSLSGFEVLLALQSASAKKSSVPRRRGGASKGRLSTGKEESSIDPGDVRPIVVRKDWAVQLGKLERDLQNLTMSAV